ncbi:MAG: 6-phosphogluconolactonase [bacterium]
MKQEILKFDGQDQCIAALAQFIYTRAVECCRARGVFTLVLSGGLTPISLYELLAGEKFGEKMDWGSTHLFWGDERFVPVDDPENNYTMTRLAMTSQVLIPEANIHRIRTEMASAAAAALDYEAQLREFATLEPESMGRGRFPRFDLVLLGLGYGGHTASLFAGRPELMEKERWVVEAAAPQLDFSKERVTMTLPVFNNARCVAFLLFGDEKRAILDEIQRNPDEAAKEYPAAMVRPAGELKWFVA